MGIQSQIRIGFGYDSHRIDKSRTLVLGGIKFDGLPGLAGHSDADVLIHSIIDAILSAAGGKDIGEMFPNNEPRFKDISSVELLKLSIPSDWKIEQIDATIICDRPKISDVKDKMISFLKSILGNDVAITIKGKSTEGLGFLGRHEGIVAFAIALLSKK